MMTASISSARMLGVIEVGELPELFDGDLCARLAGRGFSLGNKQADRSVLNSEPANGHGARTIPNDERPDAVRN
jgi:hypothetical protein